MSGAITPLPQYTSIVWPETILLLPTYCTRRDLGPAEPTTVPPLTYRLAPEEGSKTGLRNATLRLITQQSIEYFWGVTPCRLVDDYRSITCNATVDCVTQARCFETCQPTRRHIPGDFNDESDRIQSYLAVLVIALTAVTPYTLVTALMSAAVRGPRVATCSSASTQAVTWDGPFTAETRVRSQFSPRATYGGHSGTVPAFSRRTSVSPVSIIPRTLHTYPIVLLLQGQLGGAWEPFKQSTVLGDSGTPPPSCFFCTNGCALRNYHLWRLTLLT
jgi:hypothetical protein